MHVVVVVLFVATLMSSCATQRYGRMQNVSEAERSYLTCEQIEIETEKANAFIREVAATNSEFTGRDVLGFLGDFGIGNHMEFSDAVESGQRRLGQLEELKTQKGCRYQVAAPPSEEPGKYQEPGYARAGVATSTYTPPAPAQSGMTDRTVATRRSLVARGGGACWIKGNIERDGSRLFYAPGHRWYDLTSVDPARGEGWFCSEQDANAAGWQRAPE